MTAQEASSPHQGADHLVPAPDCGMKYLSRTAAGDKLDALVQATKIVRAEIA